MDENPAKNKPKPPTVQPYLCSISEADVEESTDCPKHRIYQFLHNVPHLKDQLQKTAMAPSRFYCEKIRFSKLSYIQGRYNSKRLLEN